MAFFNSLDRRAKKTIDLPSSTDVGAIFVDHYGGNEMASLAFTRQHKLKKVSTMSSELEPMRWPLLFIDGTPGWALKMKSGNGPKVTMHAYHKYIVHDRLPNEDGGVRLPQQGSMLWAAYLTVEHARCEASTLQYHTDELGLKKRTDTKKGVDEAANGDGYILPNKVGTPVRLSSSFVGGGRYYYEKLAVGAP